MKASVDSENFVLLSVWEVMSLRLVSNLPISDSTVCRNWCGLATDRLADMDWAEVYGFVKNVILVSPRRKGATHD